MDPLSALAIAQQVTPILLKIVNFCKSIAKAPEEFKILQSEANSMGVCIKVLEYKECRELIRWLFYHRREQWRDLWTITNSCSLTMTELIDFVNECKILATGKAYQQQPRSHRTPSLLRRLGRLIKHGAILAFATVKMATTNKQPMRDKLAIPTRALNIYLVTLTMVSMPYNQRLAGGPTVLDPPPPIIINSPSNPQLEGWEVVGKQIAFKTAYFSSRRLAARGIEDRILTAAGRIVNGETCCRSCDDDCVCTFGDGPGTDQRGRRDSTSNPMRGKAFIGVVRNRDGTKEIVRNVPPGSRSMSLPRLLTDFPFNPDN